MRSSIVRGLSATVILMSYALVESKMWAAIVRLTNSDNSINPAKLAFLSDPNNWKFAARQQFLLSEYQIDICNLQEYEALGHLSNLRNFVAHGGNINIERANTSDDFEFSKDSLRKALLFYNRKYQVFFKKKNINDPNKVEELLNMFLTYELVNFYY